MSLGRNEPLFNLTVVLASAAVFVAYTLGVFLDPVPAAVVAALVVAGVAVVVAPHGARLLLALGGSTGVVVAGYLLFAMQRTLFGDFFSATEYPVQRAAMHDLVPLFVLLALIVALGTAPDIFFAMIRDASDPIVQLVGEGQQADLDSLAAVLGGVR